MTITGPGPGQLTVAGNAMGAPAPIFSVNQPGGQTVRMEKLRIADARAAVFAGGGISKFGAGALEVDTVWLFDNVGGQGGALFCGQGTLAIRNSTLNNNHAQFGGAIVLRKGTMMFPPCTGTLTNSTLTGNGATEFGGALNPVENSTITILSSTITDNVANEDNNTSGDGGGIYNNVSTVNIANSILAGNTVGSGAPSSDGQCAGAAFASFGHNLRSAADTNCSGFSATGDVVNANPMLGDLGANGGPTQTIPLLAGSPAIEGGNPSPPGSAFPLCPTTDQRGLPRGGAAGTCDIGAFEVQPPPPPQPPAPGGGATTTPPPFNLKAAVKKCKKKFPKGKSRKINKKRKRCIKRAKKRARA